MLPQTIVIDANGIIVYNAVGSVTYEVLENLLSQAEESANPNQDHKTGRRIGKSFQFSGLFSCCCHKLLLKDELI